VNNITALLTEWAKMITPALLIVVAIQQWWTRRAADKAAAAAAAKVAEVASKTEAVRQALATSDNSTNIKLDSLAVSSDKIHTLVNSNMGVQLRISASALRRVADFSKDPKDERIAEEAERLAQDHESKQHKVDEKEQAGKD
jgi:hypothetical protein